MTVVYWSPMPFDNQEIPFVAYQEPVKMIDIVTKEKISLAGEDNKGARYKACPAFQDTWKNVYGLRFPYDYSLKVTEDNFFSSNYDQQFFDHFVSVRSMTSRIFSFRLYILFVSEKPLKLSLIGPHFEDNSFANSVRVVPGEFDIGKWVRSVECGFIIKDGVTQINLVQGDIYEYIKFHCDDEVELKKFVADTSIDELVKGNLTYGKYKRLPSQLGYYYNAYQASQQHKKLIRHIQNNLLI